MKKLYGFIVSATLLSLSGCASAPTSLNANTRNQFERLDVVVLPATRDPLIYTSGQEAAAFSAFLIGGGIAANDAREAAAKRPEKVFGDYLKKNHINIQRIVQTEINSQLVDSGYFQITDKAHADGILTVTISGYGYGQKGLWSDYERAQVWLFSTLTDKHNKVIAKMNGYATPFRDDTALTLKQIFERPDQVRSSLVKASHVAVHDIVEKLSAK